jgi:hypothetical protein
MGNDHPSILPIAKGGLDAAQTRMDQQAKLAVATFIDPHPAALATLNLGRQF